MKESWSWRDGCLGPVLPRRGLFFRDFLLQMASLVSNLSSTVSRLSLLRKSSLQFRLRVQSKWSKPRPPFLRVPTNYDSVRFSSRSKLVSASLQEEELTVLGIETSCDDTAAAVVRSNGEILSQVVSSQADLLERYGGVAPKMAEEAHLLAIDQVVQDALDKANITEEDLSAVAVTIGPGLSLCLRVGVSKARKLAGTHILPIVGVHHMEAHALVARLVQRDLQFPFMALLISGGHNLLILARDLGHYIQLGTTIDDAIGEAYDKTAKWLGLDMKKSGGPAVEELAREGDENSIKFKVPMKQHKDCNFSYAGLKTQVRLAIESKKIDAATPVASASVEDRRARADIAASFQRVAVLHLEEKCKRAINWAFKIEPSIKHLVLSGGVACNQYVRSRLNTIAEQNRLQLVCPPPSLCTDNGVMIAWTGIEHFRMGRYDPPPPACEPADAMLDLRPRWPLGEEYAEGRSEARSLKTARVHPSLTSQIQASIHCHRQPARDVVGCGDVQSSIARHHHKARYAQQGQGLPTRQNQKKLFFI
ncbi:probable tRNA N6-adenosine threonylcarbamoyltransferase, mitochondrial isoform X3 [Andrographis paniculata]|uniref:probable tRNA N6-adenosine threonylcarbamoyltransferase, mitochondrial isoform X3 n=1 Tax=Andrographis paniculata TaxID=175694 RepID=UPI0021E7E282|nr:probable tRNA N6-adenosine threonylcarbamoyltransferase, mitochondrial isoform X3 [Andrographis paniculata]